MLNGYILLSRKLLDSPVWRKPPLYQKVWIYILLNAQYAKYKNLGKGQLHTSIAEIQEACSYYAGYRKEMPTKKQIYSILEWLRNPCGEDYEREHGEDTNGAMIITTKVTRGMIVTVCNFNDYQDSNFYEQDNGRENGADADSNVERMRTGEQGNTIKEEDIRKNKKEKKKRNISDVIVEYTENPELASALLDFVEMRKTIKAPLTERAISGILKKLDEMSSSDIGKIAVLEQSIERSWRGIFPLKEQEKKVVEREYDIGY